MGADELVLGAVIGSAYGILAAGLVLVHRVSGLVNFAHVETGAVGASLLLVAVRRWHIPYSAAFVLAIGASAGAGALVELAVVRRLRSVPKVMAIVATLGAGHLMVLIARAMAGDLSRSGELFPEPPGTPVFRVGALVMTPARSALVLVTPLVVVALAVWLIRSKTGLAVRAVGANAEAARMSGISAGRMSALAWAVAGALSGFTALMVLPASGQVSVAVAGPALLLRALAAAVVGRLVSLPVAFGAGIALGVVETVLDARLPTGGASDLALFGVVLVGLAALGRARSGGPAVPERWISLEPPRNLRRTPGPWVARHPSGAALGLALVVGALVGGLATNAVALAMSVIFGFALVGMSVGVVTGLGGQLSLGQFALAGVGATASALVTRHTGNYGLGLAGAGAAAAALAVAVGLASLRHGAWSLAVATLAFAVASETWLFEQPWMLGEGLEPGRPVVAGFALDTGRRYYGFALVVLGLGLWIYGNLRRGGFGRVLVAVRDNERAARSFGVRADARRLQSLAAGGVLAGVGGAVYGHSLASISGRAFPATASTQVVVMAVVGGLALTAGPVLGALYVVGVPLFVPLDAAALAGAAFGWLLLILYVPEGLAGLVRPLGDRLLRRVPGGVEDGSRAPAPEALGMRFPSTLARGETTGPGERQVLLELRGLRKGFGGVTAVDGVTLSVPEGQTVAVIGPNGAGKTVLLDLASGFTAPETGRVIFAGRDVTGLAPEDRARLGMARSFQDPALFGTLSVVDTVRLSMERAEPARLVASALGMKGVERAKSARAGQLVDFFGLGPYRHHRIAELSTGTRRVVELACMAGLEPRLLLLDEPSAGMAQAEQEELSALLVALRAHLGATVVLVEHNVKMAAEVCDRMVVMVQARVIADGTPAEVLARPDVVRSYLGDVAVLAADVDASGAGVTGEAER